MPSSDKPPVYRSFLLRFWEERGEQASARVWRCSLEDPLTGDRHGFASLKVLMDWLNTELYRAAPAASDPDRLP